MRLIKFLLTMIAGCATASCAIHPLPQDVAPLKTQEIVNHIRCEAKDALERKLIEHLASLRSGDDPERLGPEAAALLAKGPNAGGISFAEFNDLWLKRLKPKTRDLILKYQNSAIAYDFNFDIAENNDAEASMTFGSVLPDGRHSFLFDFQNKRKRESIRTFKLVDIFRDLILKKNNCDQAIPGPNYMYPITGTIGLDEMVSTFVDLNEATHMTAQKSDDKDHVPVMVDTLKFTTTISGQANPTVHLAGASRLFRLGDASLNIQAGRTDEHQVIVGISAPPTGKAKIIPSGQPMFLFGSQNYRAATNPATLDALQATDYQKWNNYLLFGNRAP